MAKRERTNNFDQRRKLNVQGTNTGAEIKKFNIVTKLHLYFCSFKNYSNCGWMYFSSCCNTVSILDIKQKMVGFFIQCPTTVDSGVIFYFKQCWLCNIPCVTLFFCFIT